MVEPHEERRWIPPGLTGLGGEEVGKSGLVLE